MKRSLKALLAGLLVLALVFGLVPGMTRTAYADNTETSLTTITPTGKTTHSATVDGVVTVSHNNDHYSGTYGWLWQNAVDTLTVSACEGYTITKCIFKQNAKDPVTDSSAPFELHFDSKGHDVKCRENYAFDGVTSIEVYGYVSTVAVTGVTLNKTSTTLTVGGTETLTATVEPSNATDKTVTWSSDKEAVATVDADGVVTAVAAGTATITATATNGTADDTTDDKTATCAVTVNKATAAAPTPATVVGWTPNSAGITCEDENYQTISGQEFVLVEKGETPDWSNAKELDEDGLITYEDLTPATEYVIYTRVKETATTSASAAVTTGFVTSLESWGIYGDSGFVGATVTVVPEPEDATGLEYQWYQAEYPDENTTIQGDPIDGATSATFSTTEADLGKGFILIITKGGEEVGSTEIGPMEYGTVEFDTCGGSSIDDLTGTVYGDKVTKPADPTREGYIFAGWYKDEEYEEAWDFENDTLEYGYVILYAKWEEAGEYKIIAGANATWTQGSGQDLTITSDAVFSKFVKVTVDGKDVDPANYSAVSGSTKVTLKFSYLQTLAAGSHTFVIVSTDGEAATTLTVKAAQTHTAVGDNPPTGDELALCYWIVMMTLAGIGLGAALTLCSRKAGKHSL